MDWLVIVLRLLHIGGGIFWVGGAFTFFLFVAPSTQVLAPPNRKAFIDEFAVRRRYPTIVLVAATITILAGAVLYWRTSGGFNPVWITSPTGLGFTTGGLAGLGAWLVAALVIGPTFQRIGQLGEELMAAGRPPTAEEGARMAALAGRLQLAGRTLLVLLAIAVLFMAISRYLR